MEISQIRNVFPFMFQGTEKEEAAVQARNSVDTVDVHAPELLTDEEAEAVLNETIGMIGADSAAALSVHSGLNENRVFALLGI